nr:mucin-2-like [Lytechinus pictus]
MYSTSVNTCFLIIAVILLSLEYPSSAQLQTHPPTTPNTAPTTKPTLAFQTTKINMPTTARPTTQRATTQRATTQRAATQRPTTKGFVTHTRSVTRTAATPPRTTVRSSTLFTMTSGTPLTSVSVTMSGSPTMPTSSISPSMSPSFSSPAIVSMTSSALPWTSSPAPLKLVSSSPGGAPSGPSAASPTGGVTSTGGVVSASVSNASPSGSPSGGSTVTGAGQSTITAGATITPTSPTLQSTIIAGQTRTTPRPSGGVTTGSPGVPSNNSPPSGNSPGTGNPSTIRPTNTQAQTTVGLSTNAGQTQPTGGSTLPPTTGPTGQSTQGGVPSTGAPSPAPIKSSTKQMPSINATDSGNTSSSDVPTTSAANQTVLTTEGQTTLNGTDIITTGEVVGTTLPLLTDILNTTFGQTTSEVNQTVPVTTGLSSTTGKSSPAPIKLSTNQLSTVGNTSTPSLNGTIGPTSFPANETLPTTLEQTTNVTGTTKVQSTGSGNATYIWLQTTLADNQTTLPQTTGIPKSVGTTDFPSTNVGQTSPLVEGTTKGVKTTPGVSPTVLKTSPVPVQTSVQQSSPSKKTTPNAGLTGQPSERSSTIIVETTTNIISNATSTLKAASPLMSSKPSKSPSNGTGHPISVVSSTTDGGTTDVGESPGHPVNIALIAGVCSGVCGLILSVVLVYILSKRKRIHKRMHRYHSYGYLNGESTEENPWPTFSNPLFSDASDTKPLY